MPALQKTISPVDGRVYVERALATPEEINEILRSARHAQRRVAQRAARGTREGADGASATSSRSAATRSPQELTWQMGRPLRYTPSEVRGTLERARHMIAIAPQRARRHRRRRQG